MLPTTTINGPEALVLDPTHSAQLETMEQWANAVTLDGQSHHFVKQGHIYIFPVGLIQNDNWHHRNRQNFKWTMQGLSGINGVSAIGKAQVCFKKHSIEKTTKAFKILQRNKPFDF